jgi:hypothetical protein
VFGYLDGTKIKGKGNEGELSLNITVKLSSK